jgi:hypothetical protein
MLAKITHVDEFQKPVWLESMGDHNTLPTPCQESSVHALISALQRWPTHLDWRQIKYGDGGIVDTYILWFSDCAFAVCLPTHWRCGGEGESDIVYDLEDLQFFRIGCVHDYKNTPTNKRNTECRTCEKCGDSYEWDYSD